MNQDFYKHSKKQVLIIEDNLADAKLIENTVNLSPLIDCNFKHVETLAEGIATLESGEEYAAILLDLTLSDSVGLISLEKIISQFPDSTVIAMTGNVNPSNIIRALELGAQDYFNKDYIQSGDLAKTIRFAIDRKSVSKRLNETQRLARIGSWTCSPSEAFFHATEEVYRIFGLNPAYHRYSYLDILSSVNPFYVLSKFHDEVISRRCDVQKDITIKDAKGEIRQIYIQCSIKSEGNDPVLQGILQDITERKKAEQQIIQTNERYQDIFSKSKDAIYVSTVEGKFIDFNQATSDLIGYPQDILKQVNIHSFFRPTSSKDIFLNTLKQLKSVKDFEVEIEGRDQQKKYCVISANILDDDSSKSLTYSAIIRDITIRKQAESFKKARDFAQHAAKMREQFIATISHEMRTPMNAIIGMTNLLLDTPMDHEQLNYTQSIKNSSEILLGIINDILDLSSLKNGKIEFKENTFDLHEQMVNLINVMQGKIKEKELSLQMNIYDGLPKKIIGDKLRLNQILFNLIGNAIKFTDEGSISIGVLPVENHTNDGNIYLKFFVEDTGIGIPPGKVQSIFESFTRVQYQDKTYEGTGLGLSIVKALVEQQNGRIWFESKVGIGSTFFFELPFKPTDEDKNYQSISNKSATSDKEITTISESNDNNAEQPTYNHIHILLVEDHKLNQIVATKTLQKLLPGINIDIAENGKIAIDKIQQNNHYSVILMDIQMPVMDGYEATQYIRNKMSSRYNHLPIIAMTAHAFIANEEEFSKYGFDEYILKPFDAKEMKIKILKLINNSNVNA
ncbi:MAG: response regulator [Saprospiraceae bacterium]|nr:response regulator [Saprospiraceae bacterium]